MARTVDAKKLKLAGHSVKSWFRPGYLIVVTKPVKELKKDAHIIKKFVDERKWNDMSNMFKHRFGVRL